MKKDLLFKAGLSLCILVSCTKRADLGDKPTTWKEVTHYASDGSGGQNWKTTKPAEAEIIRFEPEHVFYSSKHPEFNRYRFEAHPSMDRFSFLKVYKHGATDTATWLIKHVSPNSLQIEYNCIEGCGKRFSNMLLQ